MSMRSLVVAGALAMLALIAAAFVFDCHRLALQARVRVELADQELLKHEKRLVKVLTGSPTLSPEVQHALAAYNPTAAQPQRHAAYEKIVAALRQSVRGDAAPAAPLARKFMDDVAGAINRRETAEPAYDAEIAAYHDYMSGTRGAVVNWVSPPDEAN